MAEDSDVEVKFGASIEGLKAGIEEAKESLEGLTEPITGIVSAFGELQEALIAAFAIEGIHEFAESMAKLGLETERASVILAEPIQNIAQLKLIATATGGSLEELEMAFAHMSRSLSEGAKPATAALNALHLTAADLAGKEASDQLGMLADALSKVRDGATKDTIAMNLFGRAGVEMLPMLNEGRAAIEEYAEMAERAGVVLNGQTLGGMTAVHSALTELTAALEGDAIVVWNEFRSVIIGAIKYMTDIAEEFSRSAKESGLLHASLDLLRISLQLVESSVVLVTKGLQLLWTDADTMVQVTSEDFKTLGKVIADVFRALSDGVSNFFTGLEKAASIAVGAVGQEFVGLGSVISNALTGHFSEAGAAMDSLKSKLVDSGKGIHDALSASVGGFDFSSVATDLKSVHAREQQILIQNNEDRARLTKQGVDELNAIWRDDYKPGEKKEGDENPTLPKLGGKDTSAKDAAEEAQTEIKIWDDQAKLKEDRLNEELKLKQITTAQWLAGTKDALQDELQDTIATYQQELTVANLTAQQRKVINDKMTEAIAANAVKVQQAEAKAAEESVKEWDSATSKINGAFTSQIDGLLKGTTNISTAFKNVFVSLTEDMLKFFVEWGLKAAENAALQIASQNSITSGIIAALGLQGAAQATATKPAILANITADVGEAFAGFAAFLAPTLGPAAIPAATGLAASVQGTATGLAAFDIGSWSVPHDMPANIHQGEMIVPASHTPWAQSLMANAASGRGGGGGGSVHNHTWNIMGASDPREVARQVAKIFNTQPSLRPAY